MRRKAHSSSLACGARLALALLFERALSQRRALLTAVARLPRHLLQRP